MKIITINDAGTVEQINCSTIEPAIMSPGKLLIDKGERDDGITLVELKNILRIVD